MAILRVARRVLQFKNTHQTFLRTFIKNKFKKKKKKTLIKLLKHKSVLNSDVVSCSYFYIGLGNNAGREHIKTK